MGTGGPESRSATCPHPPAGARAHPPGACIPPLLGSGPLLSSCPFSFTAQHSETKSASSGPPLPPIKQEVQVFERAPRRGGPGSRHLAAFGLRDAGPDGQSQRPAPAGRPRPRRARLAGVKSRLRRRKAAGEGRPGRAPTSSPLRRARNVGTVPSAWYVCVNIVSLASRRIVRFLISLYRLRPARVGEEDGDLACPPLCCIPRRPASWTR